MNIQIFGTNKCNDTKKAIRYFKERKIKYQFIDMKQKGMSRGELVSVLQALGGFENLLDPDCRDRQALALVRYISDSSREDTLLDNQQVIRTPIVRNGRQATAGYMPDTWKAWE